MGAGWALKAAARLLGPKPAPELLAPADEEAPAALSAAACAVARLACAARG